MTRKRYKVTGVFTTGQIARMLSLSPGKIQECIDKGLMRGFRLPNGKKHRRVTYDDLRAFMVKYGIPLYLLEAK